MTEPQRPFNPVISILGDSFRPGEAPIESVVIDLTQITDLELRELSRTYIEATYELFWRALHQNDGS
jgi:predicted nucleotidyltransferase